MVLLRTLITEYNCLAGPADYGAVNQIITFTPLTENDMMCVNINIINDQICEGDETFSVSITPNQPDCITIEPGLDVGSVLIIDDDGG